MKFTHRITWNIGLNRGAMPYPASEAIEAARHELAEVKANITSQRAARVICFECDRIAEKLGMK